MAEYTVLSPIGKDRKRYEPGHPKFGTIELTDKEAKPLLDAKVVCRPGDEPVESTAVEEAATSVADDGEMERLQVENTNLFNENADLRNENEDLTAKVEAFESAAVESGRQAVLAEIPVEDRGKIVGVMKAMIEAKEGCGEDAIPNVKELNANLKDITTVKVNASLRDALMGEI